MDVLVRAEDTHGADRVAERIAQEDEAAGVVGLGAVAADKRQVAVQIVVLYGASFHGAPESNPVR